MAETAAYGGARPEFYSIGALSGASRAGGPRRRNGPALYGLDAERLAMLEGLLSSDDKKARALGELAVKCLAARAASEWLFDERAGAMGRFVESVRRYEKTIESVLRRATAQATPNDRNARLSKNPARRFGNRRK